MLKIVDNIFIQEKLGKIRRKGIDSAHFRHGLMEIGRYMAYEFANILDHEIIKVQTPLGIAESIRIIGKDDIVVISVLRASIPFSQGIMKIFPEAKQGLIGAWRSEKPPFDVSIEYFRVPELDDKTVIIADPMLATGNTMKCILEKLRDFDMDRLVIFNVISSREGLEKIKKFDVEVYTCSIEEKVNSAGYIIPGLGDVGDLAFGKPSNP